MKILHINQHLLWKGGIETYLLSLIPRLQSLGHEVLVAFGEGDETIVRNSRRFAHLDQTGGAARRVAAREMAEFLAAFRPDVVHMHNVQNTGTIAACLDAVPTILHGHDYRFVCPASTFYFRASETICERTCGPACFSATVRGHCMSLRPPYAWTYYNRVRFTARNAPRFAKVFANSAYMKNRFVRAGFRPEQVAVLPYFCPLEPIGRTGPLPSDPTLLFIGRGVPNKGYRYFVDALGRLPKRVRGIMVGDFSDDSAAQIRLQAVDCGCSERLELRPWAARDAIRETYAAATVAVVPSIWAEPFGIVGLEAFSCGVPVVASDVGGVREWLIEGQTGKLAAPKDGEALSRAIAEILNSPDQGLALGANGCELVSRNFSPMRHMDDLMSLYQSVCGTGQAPVC